MTLTTRGVPFDSLDSIFIKHQTDKSSLNHNYSPYYEMFFERLRHEPISLLELGVFSGASTRSWKEYFTKANIFGVDIVYHPELNEERVFMIEADQSKPEDRTRLAEVSYDIIIDDCSHRGIDQMDTFATLFQSLKNGGYYVIEDILCSYDDRWRIPYNIMDFVNALPGYVQMNGAVPGSQLCSNKNKAVQLYEGNYYEKKIEFVTICMGIVFIKKMS